MLGITPLIRRRHRLYEPRVAAAGPTTHYTFQIRTFWISLLFGIVAVLLAFVGIGFLLMIVIAVWIIVRCIKGLQAAANGQSDSGPANLGLLIGRSSLHADNLLQ